jgi:MFS family permease
MAATIAVYMFTVGITALFWGPFCDRWGRRSTLLISCAAFTGVSVGCALAPKIESALVRAKREEEGRGKTTTQLLIAHSTTTNQNHCQPKKQC